MIEARHHCCLTITCWNFTVPNRTLKWTRRSDPLALQAADDHTYNIKRKFDSTIALTWIARPRLLKYQFNLNLVTIHIIIRDSPSYTKAIAPTNRRGSTDPDSIPTDFDWLDSPCRVIPQYEERWAFCLMSTNAASESRNTTRKPCTYTWWNCPALSSTSPEKENRHSTDREISWHPERRTETKINRNLVRSHMRKRRKLNSSDFDAYSPLLFDALSSMLRSSACWETVGARVWRL